MNITEYVLKYGNATFDERPFNEVDSLILTELSYLNFTGIVGSGTPKYTLGELSAHRERLVFDTLLLKSNRKLVNAVSKSRRFGDIVPGYFNERNDRQREIRFAAITFFWKGAAYVAFRGTDVTLIGWKEDFNMSFSRKIPSQGLAVKYLEKIAGRVDGDFIVGGHSKGGNLAVYAAVHCCDATKKRISAVYNHDGPGFHESIFKTSEYLGIKGRIFKTIPHDSLVGILLHHTEDYDVVVSRSFLIGQHNPFAWEVKDCCGFEKLSETTKNSRLADKTLSRFIEDMDMDTRRKFVEALYTIIEGSGAEKIPEFRRGFIGKMRGMKEAFKALPKDSKELLTDGGKKLLEIWINSIRNKE